MTNDNSPVQLLGRRAFLQNGTLLLTAAAKVDASSLFTDDDKTSLRVGRTQVGISEGALALSIIVAVLLGVVLLLGVIAGMVKLR